MTAAVGKFCGECGNALEPADRFCIRCGTALAAAPVTSPAPPVPARAGAAARAEPSMVSQLRWEFVLGMAYGGISALLGPSELRVQSFVVGFATAFVLTLVAHLFLALVARVLKPLAVLLALLLLVGGTASAASYFVSAPDLPDGVWSYVPDVRATLAGLEPVSGAPITAPAVAAPTLVPDPQALRARQVREQVRAAGLPVTRVAVVTAPDGKDALMIGLAYDRLVSALSESYGIGESVDAFVRLAGVKTFDLTGLGYVTSVLEDPQGRPLFAVTVPASVIEAFRAGTASQATLIEKLAFKAESRAGLIDAVRRQLGR